MSVPLVVILGAGASLAAGTWPHRSTTPPLTLDLFDEARYGAVLDGYELAHQAGRYVTSKLQREEPPAFEALLRSLRESSHAHHRHMSVAVPLYLQELLLTVSTANSTRAEHYDRLIERLLTLDYVYFVTLNYDVLLDRRLHSHHRLGTEASYITSDDGKNWALLKPHGSVNWYRHLDVSINPMAPPHQIAYTADAKLGFAPPTAELWAIRDNAGATPSVVRRTSRYPALALPEGPDDEIVMPERHKRHLVQGVARAAAVDLLVLGYSGYDKEVLTLLADALRQGRTRLRRTTVVNRDHPSAHDALMRLNEAGLVAVWHDVRPEELGEWVRGGGLDHLIDHYGEGPTY